ncbi:hypothetical protein [Shimia sp.]|uniref:hypothetical protein n=1 Tax=Shimia sp. TaxID=1954381 RepID=UPI003BA9A4E5
MPFYMRDDFGALVVNYDLPVGDAARRDRRHPTGFSMHCHILKGDVIAASGGAWAIRLFGSSTRLLTSTSTQKSAGEMLTSSGPYWTPKAAIIRSA